MLSRPLSSASVRSGLAARDWVDEIPVWGLLALFLTLALPGVASMPLFEPDEGRYAEIPREMLASGDWVTPRLAGVVYFEKPPLYYWLSAAALAALGPGELSVRLVSLLSAASVLLFTYFLGRSIAGRRAAVYAAVALGTSLLLPAFARINAIDMALTLWVTAALACFWWARSRPAGGRWAWYGVFGAGALAVLTKGLIGIVIPGAVIFLYLLLGREWRLLLRVPWLTGSLLFAVIAVPWHLLAAARNPGFLHFYFVREHFLRYTTDIAERHGPIYYFLPVILLGLLPWSGLLPAVAGLLGRGENGRRRPEVLFLLLWSGFVVVFFSLSRSKLVPYVLPALPALVLLASLVLAEVEGGATARLRTLARRGLMSGAVVLWLLLGVFLAVSLGVAGRVLPGGKVHFPAMTLFAVLGVFATFLGWRELRREAWPRAVRGLAGGAGALFACVLVAAGPVAQGRSARPLAQCLAPILRPDDTVVTYRAYAQTLPFYLDRQVDVVQYRGELEHGISLLPEADRLDRFPSESEFRARWNSDERIYLVTEQRFVDRMWASGYLHARIIHRERKLVLLANQLQDVSWFPGCRS